MLGSALRWSQRKLHTNIVAGFLVSGSSLSAHVLGRGRILEFHDDGPARRALLVRTG